MDLVDAPQMRNVAKCICFENNRLVAKSRVKKSFGAKWLDQIKLNRQRRRLIFRLQRHMLGANSNDDITSGIAVNGTRELDLGVPNASTCFGQLCF